MNEYYKSNIDHVIVRSRLNGKRCNLKQRLKSYKDRRECKKRIKKHECRKDYMWNPRYLLKGVIKSVRLENA